MTLFRLDGRTALVTGASGALGAEFARALAGAGARVVLAARRVDAMRALADSLPHAHAIALDVTDLGSVARAVADAEAWAGAPVDLLVNNSGIATPGAALDQGDEDWARVMGVNLDGARRMAVAVAARLVATGRPGAIVNVASILGLRQGAGVSAYATSKAALIQLTRQHALEWARHRIRVNALAPGYVETDLNRDFFATDAGQAQIRRIPQRRLGRAEELSGPLLLLSSDAGSFMTGSVIVADGGHLLSPL
ncbi:SDR family NAD(P)-dependent oxidoreductase [Paracoccus sp. ME4]|uniref:SDR family NAD(P)-dependent oxidoreductase n=1 Tax=Paracoccus sp. ME4 TaxID=3138066 RepID=UPI00398B8E40